MHRIATSLMNCWKGTNNIIVKPNFSQQTSKNITEQEIKIVLMKKFPKAKTVSVQDASGGCGAMFNILIESSEFNGLSVLKQHKAVYETLQREIKKMHGLHIETKTA